MNVTMTAAGLALCHAFNISPCEPSLLMAFYLPWSIQDGVVTQYRHRIHKYQYDISLMCSNGYLADCDGAADQECVTVATYHAADGRGGVLRFCRSAAFKAS